MQANVVTDVERGPPTGAQRSLSRRHPRAPRFCLHKLTAIVDFGTCYEAGEVADISASGCSIRFPMGLPPGLRFDVMLDHRHDARLPLELPVRVVRVEHPAGLPPLVAVEFVDLSQVERERLHSFVVGHGVAVDRVRRRRSA